MAVAKRQGRSEDQSEDFRQNKQHSWLSPICVRQAQVEEKHIKGGAKALSLGSWTNRATALRQISVTALFYLEDSRRVRERERERERKERTHARESESP